MGAAGHYRRFIKNFAAIAAPLNGLLREDVPWPTETPEDARKSFEALKLALARDCILAHPDWGADLRVECDASVHGLGCSLAMARSTAGVGKVIQFASRALQKHEKNYSQSELEALCVVWALSLLRPYLLGRKFVVVTDWCERQLGVKLPTLAQ